MRPDPDLDLVRRAGAGDAAAIRALIQRKLPRVLTLARRILGDAAEAEDVAQETMLRAWRRAARWRPGVARFDTWLHTVALNLCRDRLRRRREPAAAAPEAADPPRQERGLQAIAVGARVEAALQDLPPRQREAIALVHYQELSLAEAAGVLGASAEAVESLLARARRALRVSLQDLINE